MKLIDYLIVVVGVTGSAITTLCGGWTSGIITLLIFMSIDFITGLIVASVFKNSLKTQNGALESRTCWKGLCRKGIILAIVVVANRLDLEMGTTYIRDAVIIAFVTNELISIIENAGLMGVPIPTVITNCIDILKNKTENNQNNNNKGDINNV